MFTEASHRISTKGHAVVIGASMAGLLASRILVEHFDPSIVPHQAKYSISGSGEVQKNPSPILPELGVDAR